MGSHTIIWLHSFLYFRFSKKKITKDDLSIAKPYVIIKLMVRFMYTLQ